MRTRYLTLGDTVTVDNGGLLAGGDHATIVGTGAVWTDGSDATYADIVTQMHGTGQPQFASAASCAITAGDLSTMSATTAKVFARLRVAALSADMPCPSVALRLTSSNTLSGQIADTCPTTAAWIEIPLTVGNLAGFLLEPAAYSFSTTSPFKTGGDGDKHWHVYEAELYAIGPGGDAPPCRMFPRSDGLGVGAGRNYPPTKSQQRSSRGVGYY